MGEQKGSLWLVVIGLVLFGAMIFVAKPMMENMMNAINDKMQNTIDSVDTGIGTRSYNTSSYSKYIDGLMA